MVTEARSQVGRPRQPLLIGQRNYVEFAYRNRLKTQLDIAAHIRVALPRVYRHLVEMGLHTPFNHGTAAHNNTVRYALEMYVKGDSIGSIQATTGIVTSELYKALHADNIPLRMEGKRGRRAKQNN